MKNLRTYLLCACVAAGLSASAQTQNDVPLNEPNLNKPRLFNALPENIPVTLTNLADILSNEAGSKVNMSLTSTLRLEGQVVSNASKYNNAINSVVVRLSNYSGAVLTLSKSTNADGTFSYIGRIVSLQHGDLFELQNVNGQYSFTKKNFYALVNE